MIDTRVPFRLVAAAFAVAGIVAIVYWLVHPLAHDGAGMLRDESYWQLRASQWSVYANLLLVVLMLASLAASFGVATLLREKAQPLAGLSLLAGVPGHVLLAAAGIFNAYVATTLAADPATRPLLDLKGPLLGGPLHGAFGLGGMLFYGGYLGLAAALKRAGLIGWWTTLAFVPAGGAIAMHPMLPFAFRLAGFVIFGLACLRVAVACWKRGSPEVAS